MTAPATANPYADAARTRKAVTVAAFLHREGFTVADVEGVADVDRFWRLIARATGTHPASPQTREVVVRLVADLDHTPADPFAGVTS